MITQKTIQEIVETSRIEDVVSEYVNLKKRGANMLGLCPFHNEKTPSFTVSPAKNIYKCFGCGKGGDPVNFVMEHEGSSYPEALRHLAEKYSIEIEETQTSQAHRDQQQKLDSLYLINQFARDYYKEQLLHTDIGKSVGLSYFKNRGFTNETIEKFGLGYAPADKDAFTQAAKRKGYKEDQLKRLGLTSKYNSDFFRDRVMFAIHNLSGKVIGFGGRIMAKNIKAPKYVNSPETEIYNKSKVLYGAYFAKREIRKTDQCILVEGYTDVLSLHQAGIENVVASSGTSLTVDQINLVRRYTPNMKILYDGDAAGIKAALRGLDLVLEQNMNVQVVLLPEKEDPDSYLQKVGVDAFRKYIEEEAKDFILFKSELLLSEAAGNPVKQSEMIKDIVSSIAKIPDPLKRSLYIKECAHLTKVEEQILINETNKLVSSTVGKINEKREFAKRKQQRQQQQDFPDGPPPEFYEDQIGEGGGGAQPDASAPKQKPASNSEAKENNIIKILISSGGQWYDEEKTMTVAHFILGNIEDILDNFENNLHQQVIQECLELTMDGTPFTQQYFIQHADPKIQKLASDILIPEFEMSEGWIEKHNIPLRSQPMPDLNFNKDSLQTVYRLKLSEIEKLTDKNQQSLKIAQDEKNEVEMLKFLKIHAKLLEIRKEIAETLNLVILK